MHQAKPRDDRTRARIPNKTQKALERILENAEEARSEMQMILCWLKQERSEAKRRNDQSAIERLGDLSARVGTLALAVANMERLTADARQGRYREPELPKAEKNGVLP